MFNYTFSDAVLSKKYDIDFKNPYIVNAGAGSGFESVIAKLLGASIFPIGLMLVVFCGAKLFTGNCVMTISVFKKEITVRAMLRNWGIVYFANLIGGGIIGLFTG